MMRKGFLLLFSICFIQLTASAQELNATVTVVTSRVNNLVNKNAFTTLETALNNFLNTRKWSNDVFEPQERIKCNFLLNLESTNEPNVYSGFLTIQAARPIFNTGYSSPIINFKDDNVTLKYLEFQQLDFNENRVTGTQPLQSNLTAIFAYWAYTILAFDYESFGLHGGDPYFLKAQNIINNAPDGRNISGWKAFDGLRNRYWLVENMLNKRYATMHDVYYNYYRQGFDQLYDNETGGRGEVLNALNLLETLNVENPNTMINAFFFAGKSNELVKIFSKALPADKARALDILSKYDLTNADKYREGLK